MSTRDVPGGKGGRCVRLTTYHHIVPMSRYLGALTLLDPSGPAWPVMGVLYLYILLDGVGGQRHDPAALPPGKRAGIHCIGGWVGPRAGLNVCGKSRPPNGIRSLDRPAGSESLYRLSYPGPRLSDQTSTKRRSADRCNCRSSRDGQQQRMRQCLAGKWLQEIKRE
jgi:hypothetical protein